MTNTATEPMIEDPEIAASVAELRRRWPAIGAAAEHPLTEHFILRRRQRQSIFGYLPQMKTSIRGVIWFSAILLIYYTFRVSNLITALVLGASLGYSVSQLFQFAYGVRRRKIRIRNIFEPADILNENDPGRRDQLNLTGLKFPDLLAINAACTNYFWARFAVARASGILIAWIMLAAVIGLTGDRAYAIPFVALCAVLFICIGLVMCRRSTIVVGGMRMLARRIGIPTDRFWLVIIIAPIACLPLLAGGLLCWAGSTLLVWAVATVHTSRKTDSAAERIFTDCATEGQRRFQAMLNPDSADPLKELELYGRIALLEHRRRNRSS